MYQFDLIRREKDGRFAFGVRILSGGSVFREYPCISSDEEEAVRLRRRLACGDLSPVHFDDVVRDFILEQAYEKIEKNHL